MKTWMVFLIFVVLAFFISGWAPAAPKLNPLEVGSTLSGYLVNALTGKCLEPVPSDGRYNGTLIQVGECTGNEEQYWEYTINNQLWNPAYDKCLDTIGNPGTSNGTKLQMNDCKDPAENPSQVWETSSAGFFQHAISGRCIDVPGAGSTKNGLILVLYDCEYDNPSKSDQHWIFKKKSDTSFGSNQSGINPDSKSKGSNQNYGAKGILLFDSDVDGDKDIYTMDIATRKWTQLTNDPAYDGAPSWSPDGSKIVFVSTRKGTKDIYTMNADGSNQKPLISSDLIEDRPSWSPDGARVAYESDTNHDLDIWVLDIAADQVYLCSDSEADDYEGHWSADGSRVLFTSKRSGNGDIYSSECQDKLKDTRVTTSNYMDAYASYSPQGNQMIFHRFQDNQLLIFLKDWSIRSATGENEYQISPNNSWDAAPKWSSDGKMITFIRGKPWEVCIRSMGSDGDDTTCLTDNSANEEYPSFKPSGGSPPASNTQNQTQGNTSSQPVQATSSKTIVFDSDIDGDKDIYTMDITTGKWTQITNEPGYDGAPSWSPDGSQIVFVSDRAGNKDLYVTDKNGGNAKPIVQSPDDEFRPDWSYDGKKMLFERTVKGNTDIYLLNFITGKITRCTDNPAADIEAHWGYKDWTIGYTSMRDGDGGNLYSTDCNLNNDTGDYIVNIVNDERNMDGFYNPSQGDYVFHSKRSGNMLHIYSYNGSSAKQLSPDDKWDAAPSFSPDGKQIVFLRGNPFDICVMNYPTLETVCLTKNNAIEEYPSFQP